MTLVYVETNFVLELVLRQEQAESCEDLLQLGESGDVQLVIPAYSLVEPNETLVRRHRDRKRMKVALDGELEQLRRTRPLSSRLSSFQTLTTRRLLKGADVISLDRTSLGLIDHYQSLHDFSPQDAVVYACVISHLEQERPGESYFLNRNTRDFDDPAIIEELRKHSCTWIPRFDHALERLRARSGGSDDRPA